MKTGGAHALLGARSPAVTGRSSPREEETSPAAGGQGKAPVRDGALAGAVSAVAFAAVHQLTISNIWGMVIPMVIAGALCGMCIAWTFVRLVQQRTMWSWIGYNAIYLALMVGLAATSMIVFEPVTTMAAVIASAGPVDDLIVRAMPMTVTFVLASTVLLGVALAKVWSDYLRLLLGVATLTVLLGLNLSVVGLVEMSGHSLGPVALFFALIVLLGAAYTAAYAAMQWAVLNGSG